MRDDCLRGARYLAKLLESLGADVKTVQVRRIVQTQSLVALSHQSESCRPQVRAVLFVLGPSMINSVRHTCGLCVVWMGL